MKTRRFTFLIILMSIAMLGSAQYEEPQGGWDYIYNGDQADTSEVAGLDGTFEVSRGSFSWDFTSPQSEEGAPGGAGIITEDGNTFLRIQDTGDPRDYGFGDPNPSNRKIGFIHCVSHGGLDSMEAILDNGITYSFRARIPTSGVDSIYADEKQEYPAVGDGYGVDEGGYSPFSIVQYSDGDKKHIGFSFLTEFDHDTISTLGAGLYMNSLNGSEPNKRIGIPDNLDEEGITINKINLDPTQWHDFWIQIQPGGTGTHQVKIWMDGNDHFAGAETFDVTAADKGFRDYSHIFMAFKNTSESGAIDIDYIAYKKGIIEPVAASTGTSEHKAMNNTLKCYPNPVKSNATVSFDIKQDGFTTLKLYNVMGQHSTLLNENLPAGTHNWSLLTNDLQSGVYFLELETGSQKELTRIVVKK